MLILAPLALMAYVSNPVKITQCALEEEFITTTGDAPTQQAVGSQLHIRFTNIVSAPIATITFNVNVDGKDRTIVDAGTFSQGISISHYFPQYDLESSDATCRVDSVQFKDGSTWM